jgi:hypothetical protein
MLQPNYREFYLENILGFLWRQWSTLGIAGSARSEDLWVIDPESLLVFSLEMARYEPRLFDEILDWLAINGKWMDIQRLRAIVKKKDEKTQRLMSAISAFLSGEPGSHNRKWNSLALLRSICNEAAHNEVLFRTKQRTPAPRPIDESEVFRKYGFLRQKISLRKMTKPVPVTWRSNIRFLLRSLFGIGSRSECILYLLTHEAGHSTEIAKAAGIHVMAVWNSLQDLVNSGLVLTRPKGKRKIEYWLSQKRWWEFLTGENFESIQKPSCLDWISLFYALSSVWNALNEVEVSPSDYMRSSKLRDAMETISLEFAKSGLDLPAVPGSNIPPENYEEEFQKFIIKVLGARSAPNP